MLFLFFLRASLKPLNPTQRQFSSSLDLNYPLAMMALSVQPCMSRSRQGWRGNQCVIDKPDLGNQFPETKLLDANRSNQLREDLNLYSRYLSERSTRELQRENLTIMANSYKICVFCSVGWSGPNCAIFSNEWQFYSWKALLQRHSKCQEKLPSMCFSVSHEQKKTKKNSAETQQMSRETSKYLLPGLGYLLVAISYIFVSNQICQYANTR